MNEEERRILIRWFLVRVALYTIPLAVGVMVLLIFTTVDRLVN